MSSPNMSLQIPVVGVTPGTAYATDIVQSLNIIDAHDHTPGNGVAITPAAMNINATLTFNNNIVNSTQAINFISQSLNAANQSLFFKGTDLYVTDGAGNVIRVTQSGSVAGSAGTITGLPSGTASAAYAAGTFRFQSATNIAANIDAGSYVLRNTSPNSTFGLTVHAPSSLGANYDLYLPPQNTYPVGSTVRMLSIDSAGNMVGSPYLTFDGSGNATFSGNPSVKNQITIGAGLETDAIVRFIPSATLTNWVAGANYNTVGGFEFTPSTVAGGSTFTTPVLTLTTTSLTSTGRVFSSVSNTSGFTVSPSTATSPALFESANQNNVSFFGNESGTSGTTFSGSSAYGTIIGTTYAYPLQFFTNNALRMSISPAGTVTMGGSLGVTGDITTSGTLSAVAGTFSGTVSFPSITSGSADAVMSTFDAIPAPKADIVMANFSFLSTGQANIIAQQVTGVGSQSILSQTLSSSSANNVGAFMTDAIGLTTAINLVTVGKNIKSSSKNVVVSMTNATNSLGIIRATFGSGGGSPTAGEGASASHTGTGTYNITFTNGFSDVPVVSCTTFDSISHSVSITGVSTGGCSITIDSGYADSSFSIIAIGQRT